MGRIRDFFSKMKTNQNIENSSASRYEFSYDLQLDYRSGIHADIKFDDELTSVMLPNHTLKSLQKIKIKYLRQDGSFEQKDFYVEPITQTLQDGTVINNTREYFKQMKEINKPVVKGFFAKEQVEELGTDYLGYIGKDSNGNYNRSFDMNFKYIYNGVYRNRQEQKRREQEQFHLQKEESLRRELANQVQKEPHYKTSHAEDLSKYRDRNTFPQR